MKSLLLPALFLVCGALAAQPEDRIIPHGALSSLTAENGTLTLFAGWTRGFAVSGYDVSDPADISLKYGLALPGYVEDMAFSGNHLYIGSMFGLLVLEKNASGEYSLKRNLLCDFSPKAHPGKTPCVAGNTLTLQARDGALRVFDLTEPGTPVLLRYDPKPVLRSPLFSDGKNFYGIQKKTLFRFDARTGKLESVCEFPVELRKAVASPDGKILLLDRNGSLYGKDTEDFRKLPEQYRDIGLSQGACFTAQRKDGALVRFAGNFTAEKTVSLPWTAQSYCFDGDRLYAMKGDRFRFISIFDVSGPEAKELGVLPCVRRDGHLLVTEEVFYIASNGLLFTFDRKKNGKSVLPAHVTEIPGKAKPFGAYNLLSSDGLFRHGNLLLAGGALFDISNPREPKFRENAGDPFTVISGEGGNLVAACGKTIRFVECAPDSVKFTKTIPAPGPKSPVLAAFRLNGAIYAIDTAALYKLSEDGTVLQSIPADEPCTMEFRLGRIYVPSGLSLKKKTLLVYNTETGTVAELPGLISNGVSASALHGDRLYLADGMNVREFSLRDPDRPELLHVYGCAPDEPAGDTSALCIGNGFLHAKRYSRIRIWKIKD